MTKHSYFQNVTVYASWGKYILSKHVNPKARRVLESCIWMKTRSTGAIIRNVLKWRRNALKIHQLLVSLTTLSHCVYRCSVSLNSKNKKSGALVFGVSKTPKKWFCLPIGKKIWKFSGKGGGRSSFSCRKVGYVSLCIEVRTGSSEKMITFYYNPVFRIFSGALDSVS